jgi:hypothetical protein
MSKDPANFKEGEFLQFVPWGMMQVVSTSEVVEGRSGLFMKVKQPITGMTVLVPESEWGKSLRRPLPKPEIDSHLQLLRSKDFKTHLLKKETPTEVFLKLASADAPFGDYVQLMREIYAIPKSHRPIRVQSTLLKLEDFVLSEISYVINVPLDSLKQEFIDLYGGPPL